MKGVKILVVEDEAIVAKALGRRLEHIGHQVVGIVDDGEEAVEISEKERPDLVLMDIGLPGKMDGVDAAEIIQSRFDIPVIFLTAYSDDGTLGRAKEMGPYGYILKPFEPMDLHINIEVGLYKHGMEKKLRETEKRYRELFDNMSSGVAVYEAVDGGNDFIFTDFNKAGERIDNIKKEELLGRKVSDVFPGVKEFGLLKIFQKVNKTGTMEQFPLSKYDDGRISAWREGYVYKLPSGELVSVYDDVTEREKAQEDLLRLEKAFTMTNDSIMLVDLEGNILDVNLATLKLMGYKKKDELVGRNGLEIILAPEEMEKALLGLRSVLEEGEAKNAEYTIRTNTGQRIPIELNASVMTDNKGVPNGFVVISRDITERKKAEMEMRMKLMKFDLKEGELYLVPEKTPTIGTQGFKDLLKVGLNGIVLSRTPREKLSGLTTEDFEHIWLANREGDHSLSPNVKAIKMWVKHLPPKQAILIDRLDFIISNNPFKDVLELVQYLNESAIIDSHVIILSVDPALLTPAQLQKISKETSSIEEVYQGKLPEDVLSLLRVVYETNVMGTKPTYTQVGEELGLSKPTVRKRVAKLINTGYLMESVDGRSKVLELTVKSRSLFDR